MTTVRSAKAKGSCFEYDVHASLLQLHPSAYLTKERGFQRQYDVTVDARPELFQVGLAVECKRLKGISWNQLEKFYKKLVSVRNKELMPYLCFRSNNQPCLVFFNTTFDGANSRTEEKNSYIITTFEDCFGVPFIKHPSSRPTKNEVLTKLYQHLEKKEVSNETKTSNEQ